MQCLCVKWNLGLFNKCSLLKWFRPSKEMLIPTKILITNNIKMPFQNLISLPNMFFCIWPKCKARMLFAQMGDKSATNKFSLEIRGNDLLLVVAKSKQHSCFPQCLSTGLPVKLWSHGSVPAPMSCLFTVGPALLRTPADAKLHPHSVHT